MTNFGKKALVKSESQNELLGCDTARRAIAASLIMLPGIFGSTPVLAQKPERTSSTLYLSKLW